LNEEQNSLEIKKLTEEMVALCTKNTTEEVVKQVLPTFEKLESEMKARITADLEMKWGKTPVEKTIDYSYGELAQAALFKMGKFGGIKKDVLDRVMSKASDFVVNTGTLGGFLVPDQQPSTALLKPNLMWPEIVAPRAFVLPVGTPPDAKIKLPARGQTATGAMDHLSFFNRAEGGAGQQTDTTISMIELEPSERFAYVVLTDDLMANADILGAYLNMEFGEEKIFQNDYMYFKGSGASEPKGIYNSPDRIEVTRDTASCIKYADIVNMRSSMIPMSLSRASWVASVSIRKEIENMLDTGNKLVYGSGDISKGYPETLTGLPIIWSEHAAALGSKTDLSLIDFSYYVIKPGTGPAIMTSNDLFMLSRKTAIAMWWKADGKSWLNLPILLRDNVTKVSPFVILGTA